MTKAPSRRLRHSTLDLFNVATLQVIDFSVLPTDSLRGWPRRDRGEKLAGHFIDQPNVCRSYSLLSDNTLILSFLILIDFDSQFLREVFARISGSLTSLLIAEECAPQQLKVELPMCFID